MMLRLLCVLIGYGFGLLQTAFFYGKLQGIDIRTVGSGNAGTTNALRVLGRKAGVIVLLGDVLKAALAIALVRLAVVPLMPQQEILLTLYTAAGTVLGHNFPFYMQFKGGKGIAVSAGFLLAFDPFFFLVGAALFFGAFFLTHYVSLGSLLAYTGFVAQLVILGQGGYFDGLGQAGLYELYGVAALMMAMAFWKHRENIKRLLSHSENKTYLSKKKGKGK